MSILLSGDREEVVCVYIADWDREEIVCVYTADWR